MRILVVEDDFSSRKLMGMILKKYGEVDFAVNGKEAIDAFKMIIDAGEKYDIVFLDIMLPEMDGHEILQQIKVIEEENDILGLDGVKVVMTTALNDAQNIKSAFKEQCDAYLTKPITTEHIQEVLVKLNIGE